MNTEVKTLREFFPESASLPADWELKAFRSGSCLSYVAWNERTREAIVIDPKVEDLDAYLAAARTMKNTRWLGVIDTHTHADHVSAAPAVAEKLSAPYIMLQGNSNTRVSVRIAKDTHLGSAAGEIRFLRTPGHTGDSMVVGWGPFLFGGDTLLVGDTGRDDLPGGSAEEHYKSLVKLKEILRPETIILPGHDSVGIRASTWAKELEGNASLKQNHDDFVRDSNAFQAPAPKLLNESLRENLK